MEFRKKTIAVFFGGCSTEYEVSLKSAFSVMKSIDTEKYQLVLIGIERRTGKWLWYRGELEKIRDDCWNKEMCTPVFPSMDKELHGFHYMEEGSLCVQSLDAAFPILHGKNGEDGTVQGILELMGVPVIGCDLLCSALCMNKEMAHRVVAAAGIRTAKAETLKAGNTEEEVRMAARRIGYPLFVKPVRAGSSFGIAKVFSERELPGAVEEAFLHDSIVILEEEIKGFEVGCAILGTEELLTGEVDEIELSQGFFDYTEKYTLKTSGIHVPARISAEKTEEVKKTAVKIYRLLGCSFFARVDMFLSPAGEIYFNEVNTIPGFTAHSRYPNMLKAAGMSFDEIIEKILGVQPL